MKTLCPLAIALSHRKQGAFVADTSTMANRTGTNPKSSKKKSPSAAITKKRFDGVSYASFVAKLAKKNGVSLDSKALRAGDQLTRQLVDKLSQQAGKCVGGYGGGSTLSGKAVKAGLGLVLSGRLRSGAILAAQEAVARELASHVADISAVAG